MDNKKKNKFIIHVSISGICILIGVFVLTIYMIAPSLSPDDAEKRISLLLQRELSQKYMSL